MEKLNFYTVDLDYVNYLKKAEQDKRGFSRVPNMEYGNLFVILSLSFLLLPTYATIQVNIDYSGLENTIKNKCVI